MSINTLYIPFSNLPSVFLDKDTGLPLAAGVVTFYRDSQRVTPKVVYQITGTTPNYTFISMGNVLTLGMNGGFVDGNGDPFIPYAYPYDAEGALDLYYITIESEGGVPQETIDACPYVISANVPPEQRLNTDNELINPQFVEVNFPTTGAVTLSVTGSDTVTQVAPGWEIITTGTGTLELERLEPTAVNVPTNPPYSLRINASSGFGASIVLRQRLNHTPSIMRDGYCSGTMTIAIISGGSTFVSMEYAPSTGTATEVIPSTSVSTDGAYHVIANNAAIPDQVNDPATTGYVDINITIPTSRNLAITSIQVVGVLDSTDVPFDEQTVDRQKSQLFGYYEDAVVHQPKESILVGWDFALNPWQFTTTASTNLANNAYTADQTIVIQQSYVDSATGNNVAIGRGTFAANYAFQISAVTANNRCMVLQYIDPKTVANLWGDTVSVRLRGYITTSNNTTPTFKVRLMYKAGLPNTTSQTVPVSAWDIADDSIPTISGDGWTYLTAVNDPTYTMGEDSASFDFNGFVLPASSNANMTLGVCFIMMTPLDETGTPDVINLEKISLVRNDFAIEAQPETYDESLRRCQHYYQKSFLISTVPATNVGLDTGESNLAQTSNAGVGGSIGAIVRYSTPMRATPTVTLYNPAAANNQIHNATTGSDFSGTSNVNSTVNGFYSVGTTPGGSAVGNVLAVHWTANANLGI